MAVTTLIEAKQACCGNGTIRICTATGSTVTIEVLVMQGKQLDFDLLLGINAIKVLSKVHITQWGSVEFEKLGPVCTAICINEADFDEQYGIWVAAGKWLAGWAPEKLVNWISKYPVSSELREECESESQTWIDSGWLLPYSNEEFGLPKGLIPLMAVLTSIKNILWWIIKNLTPMLTHS